MGARWRDRPDGSARVLREQESLTGEDVLADFTLELSELFAGI